MATTVLGYIGTRAPTFLTDSRVTSGDLEEQVKLELDPTIFKGDLFNKAVALLMLHAMAMDDRSGTSAVGGSISEEQEDRLKRKYLIDFGLTKQFPDFSQTRWGMEFIRLRRSCVIGPRTRFTKLPT